MRAFVVAALVAACSTPPRSVGDPGNRPPQPPVTVSVDAPGPSQEEKLAAIQKAMNELDEGAQLCWATAATDRFDIAGEITATIEIAQSSAKAQIVIDTARNQKLAACLVELLGAYRWAPPLHGDTIQLPFKFTAPDGQSVIDRKLVEWHGQANVSVAVLLDETNTGNGAASMFEVAIAPRATTGMRVVDRAELWYFLGDVEVKSVTGAGAARKTVNRRMAAGTMMFVPKGTAREVIATRPDMRAVVAVTPGMREGSARAGALPTASAESGSGSPIFVDQGTKHGPATIFVEPAAVRGAPLAASVLELPADAKVPEHVHAHETELLYVLEGSGTMTIAGQQVAVTPTSVIQIPPNTKHAFVAATAVRAVQLYTPPGPEQRFRAPK